MLRYRHLHSAPADPAPPIAACLSLLVQADWPFYMALSLFRLASILSGVGARAAQGNASSRVAAQVRQRRQGGGGGNTALLGGRQRAGSACEPAPPPCPRPPLPGV